MKVRRETEREQVGGREGRRIFDLKQRYCLQNDAEVNTCICADVDKLQMWYILFQN